LVPNQALYHLSHTPLTFAILLVKNHSVKGVFELRQDPWIFSRADAKVGISLD